MLTDPVNLEEELRKERAKDKLEQKRLLEQIDKIFEDENVNETRIEENLNRDNGELDRIDISRLNPDRIYSLEQIKNICIRYRLRFLDSKYFKNEIPYEAIAKIKALQKDQDVELTNFKLLAPADLFRLEDCNKDPMLFVALGNNLFYAVHKWGNDMAWYRRLLVYPFRDILSLATTVFAMAAILAYIIPREFIVRTDVIENISSFRILFFFWLLIASASMLCLFGFAFNKNFSEAGWDSKYFNG